VKDKANTSEVGNEKKGDSMTMMHTIFKYLRNRQSAKIRYFHIVILLLVISQIVVSNFIDFTNTGDISSDTLEFYGSWTHIITGMTLFPIAVIFLVFVTREHGLKYFFPYLFGDFSQLKSDIGNLKKFKLPDPEAGGVAAIVKGLGLGALFLAILSGLAWFLSWKYGVRWSHNIKEIHELLVGFIEAYVVGHGSMGLLHIYLSTKRS
jgi:hypothetical protein